MKFSYLKKSFFVFIFFYLLGFQYLLGQLVVVKTPPETYGSPTWLAENILAGPGIEITNVSFIGDTANQIGFFNGISSNIGLDSGIVMACEDVYDVDLNQAVGGFTNTDGDPDLLTIANSVPPLIGESFNVTSINDVAILEFDFVPNSETVSFNYVFASEEYYQWENTQYNDVFAFFISGPGIVGPYDSPVDFPDGAINIAFIPGSDPELPITVSSVNASLNSEYFINNSGLNTVATCDGFTIPLTASAAVQCGETYHIKLAIADGSDHGLTSAMFLEAGSFSSPGAVEVSSITSGGQGIIIEGCKPATLVVDRAYSEEEDVIYLDYQGNAIMGVDYNMLPDSLTFDSGVTNITLPIFALDDGVNELKDTIVVIVNYIPDCGDPISDTTTIFTIDGYDITILPDDTINCDGDTLLLKPSIIGAVPDISYTWNDTLSTDSVLELSLTETQTFYVSISDFYGCTQYDSIEVVFSENPNIQASLLLDTICQFDTTFAYASGGVSYDWYPAQHMESPNDDTSKVFPVSTTNFIVVGYNSVGCSTFDTVTLAVISAPPLNFQTDTLICKYDMPQLSASGNHSITWEPSNILDDPTSFTPTLITPLVQSQTFEVLLIDTVIGCYNQKSITLYPFTANGQDIDTFACRNSKIDLTVYPLSGVEPFTYSWIPGGIASPANEQTATVTIPESTDLIVVVQDNEGCKDTVDIYVESIYSPIPGYTVDVVPGCDSANVHLYPTYISSEHQEYYVWNILDSTYFDQQDVYLTLPFDYEVEIDLLATNQFNCSTRTLKEDSISKFSKYYEPVVPNVFTPNNDDLNEIFALKGYENFKGCLEMEVYNRWGKRLFETTNVDEVFWNGEKSNGQLASEGIYFYVLKFKKETFTGSVQLLR